MATAVGARGLPGPGRPEFRFPLRFLAFATLLMATWAALTPLYPMLTGWMAGLVASASALLGLSAAAEPGAHVLFGRGEPEAFRYYVDSGCIAGPSLMIYTAAVLAYPANRRQRLLGLVVGLPALFTANLLRLIMLGWVGMNDPAHFDVIHKYWAATALLALVGGAWLTWVWLVANRASRPGYARLRRSADRTRSQSLARVRRIATPLVTFVASIAVLGVIGIVGNGVVAWGHAIHSPVAAVARQLDGVYVAPALPEEVWFSVYGPLYAMLAAVVTLFLVTPGVRWRQRVNAALLIGVPLVYIIQLSARIARLAAASTLNSPSALETGGESLGGVVGTFIGALLLALHVGVPAIVWYRWARRRRPPLARRARAHRAPASTALKVKRA